MNVLGIETATAATAVALLAPSGERYHLVLDDQRRHGEVLTEGIARLLARADLDPAQLERVVVDRGPGLFTGLRVGVATAVALALATDASLVAVTSLELLARGAWRAGVRGRLLGVVDARRGELFLQGFALGEDVVATDGARVAPASEWASALGEGEFTVTGDGAARYRELFAAAPVFDQRIPPVLEAIDLALARPAGDVTPLYLREADAVANFATRATAP